MNSTVHWHIMYIFVHYASARFHNLTSKRFWGKNRGWTTSFQLFNFGLPHMINIICRFHSLRPSRSLGYIHYWSCLWNQLVEVTPRRTRGVHQTTMVSPDKPKITPCLFINCEPFLAEAWATAGLFLSGGLFTKHNKYNHCLCRERDISPFSSLWTPLSTGGRDYDVSVHNLYQVTKGGDVYIREMWYIRHPAERFWHSCELVHATEPSYSSSSITSQIYQVTLFYQPSKLTMLLYATITSLILHITALDILTSEENVWVEVARCRTQCIRKVCVFDGNDDEK